MSDATHSADRHATPTVGRLYDVSGRQLFLVRSATPPEVSNTNGASNTNTASGTNTASNSNTAGARSPNVVFLPGAGLIGLDFWNICRRLEMSGLGTSVIYDRAGTGWSDPTALPRTAKEVAEELHALLRAAGIGGPHILVGHSLGAFYARRFTQLFPDEVAGLLLLDPGHEDIFDYLPPEAAELNEQLKPDVSQLPDLTQEQIAAARDQYTQLYSEWPDDLRVALIEEHLAHWRTQLYEVENFETEVYDELRHGGALAHVPLIVLSAAGENPYWAKFLTPEQMRVFHDGVRNLHVAIAGSVPNGEWREVHDASHQYLHIQRPDEVTSAIGDLVTRSGIPT